MTTIDPKYAAFATPRQAEYLTAVNEEGSYKGAARKLGVDDSTIRESMKSLRNRAAKAGYSPDHDYTHVVPDGYMVKGVSTYYDKDGGVASQWVKSSVDADRQREILEAAYAAISQDIPRELPNKIIPVNDENLCNLITFSDYHIGQLSWAKEGGAAWDLKIAEDMLFNSLVYMVQHGPKAKYCVLNLQGDLVHTDGLLPMTPGHGNILDADGRFSKIVATVIRVIRRLMRYLLTVYEYVHMIILEGNHDLCGSLWLRHMFTALFENEQRVTVNNNELPYYAFQFGNMMLGFHHGHKMKNEGLPLLFAAQFPVIWGNSTKRAIHCGHRHHVDEKEYSGAIVIQHPTLAARDAYASRGGWISERSTSLITYHNKFGQISRTFCCPEMIE